MGGIVMVKIILTILLLIPTMLGLAELIHNFKLYLLKPEKALISYKVILLTDNSPIEQMRYVIEQYLWQSEKNNTGIVFVNSLLSNINLIECKSLAEKYGFTYCSKEELEKYLNQIII